ncbi:MAG: APC family permease [Gammaproteobacteria bacterium]|jgi:APA family basic amino acid/polyamine antiporter|nr:APC family permease [Gammaproteobacteria bacterium]MDH3750040.1 APC family permease [Gammaproteobacteria bacterium]MDH3805536.1 APC family permease [Gammaproteobacteria bacterium]
MAANTLQRLLGKGFSIAACVGLVIGLGILRTPGEIATTVSEPVPYMALWICCGLFVLLSLLVVAELIAMTPRSGGIYAMVAHAYGPYPGFLIGWTDWVSSCASISLKAVVLLEYVSILAPSMSAYQTAGAVIVTSCFAFLQLGGARLGAGIQSIASSGFGLIMIGLAIALFYGFLSNGGTVAAPPDLVRVGSPGIAAFGLVVAAVVFTYDGWYAASYFSGEVKSGGRAVAIGSLQGALIVFALYVLLNLAIVLSVPLAALVGHDLALAGALDLVFGAGAGTVIVIAAIFILLAHQNLQYMIASRILYSLSADGLGSRRATSVNDRGTPAGAVIFTWVATSILIVAGKFEFLLNLVAILFMAMYVGLIVGVFRLRRQEPDAERPFRAWGFPATGVICAIGWTAVAVFVAVTNPMSALSGVVLTLISAPVYLWLKRRRHLGGAALQG